MAETSFPTAQELAGLTYMAQPSDEELIAQIPEVVAARLRQDAASGVSTTTIVVPGGLTIPQKKALRRARKIEVVDAGPATYRFTWPDEPTAPTT